MSNPVNITVGVVTTAVSAGLAGVRAQFQSLRSFANSQFAGALVGGGLVATLGGIVEKAGQIADISQKFGVLPEALQEMANAAEPNGATMEDVAASLNKTAISQEKVRKGSKELAQDLATLKISAEAFASATPEEAYYMVADAVAGADDRTAAYAATLNLMGKKAGVLFTTLEQGSAAIKAQGQAVGVMSADSVAALDELGDTFTNTKNKAMAVGAGVITFLLRLVSSVGAAIGAAAALVVDGVTNAYESAKAVLSGDFGEAKIKFRAALQLDGSSAVDALDEELKNIWEKKSAEARPLARRGMEVEDLEKAADAAKKLEDAEQRVANKREELRRDALTDEARLLDLEKARMEAIKGAETATDATRRVELQEKSLDLEKQIMTIRSKLSDEIEAKQERMAAKQQALQEKLFQNELAHLTEADRLVALRAKRDELSRAAANEKDDEKRLELTTDAVELERLLATSDKKAADVKGSSTLITSSLAQIGGGGGAYTSRDSGVDKVTRAVEISNKELQQSRAVLERIVAGLKARWN